MAGLGVIIIVVLAFSRESGKSSGLLTLDLLERVLQTAACAKIREYAALMETLINSSQCSAVLGSIVDRRTMHCI